MYSSRSRERTLLLNDLKVFVYTVKAAGICKIKDFKTKKFTNTDRRKIVHDRLYKEKQEKKLTFGH